jgi:hypothetical protein
MSVTRRAHFFALMAWVAFAVWAQTSTSSISGTVTDPSGAAVPGAVVTATNEATGVTNRQTTTQAGVYSFASLPIGTYTISVEVSGFKTAVRSKVVLEVNSPADVDMVLEVGQTTETVQVVDQAEMLQTANAAIGNVVSQRAIQELPLNGRNPLALLVLEPGVVQRSAGAAGSGVHVNGSRDRSHNVTVDGIEANESTVPNPLSNLYRLNPDNVAEYKVTTSNHTAEEGRNSGASVAVATRSGTNTFHGTVFEFFRNTALNANDFYNNAQGLGRNEIKLNQYGFEIGGPIVRNRTFFFGSWAGQKINFAQPVDQTYGVPTLYTPAAVSGIFRYFRPDPASPFVLDGQQITANSPALVDGQGNLRPGIRTCASDADRSCVASYDMFANDPRRLGLDPAVGRLVASLPRPNSYTAGDGLNTATYAWNPPTKVRGPNYMARIDHIFDENNSIFGRFLFGDQNTLEGDPLNNRPQLYPGFPPMGEVFRRSHNLAISYRRVISPSVVNEFTVGYARFVLLFTQGEANPDWPNVPSWARAPGTGATNAFNNLDQPYLNTPRTFRAVTTPQVLDNLSIIRGAHVIRTGFNFRFYRHNDQRGQPGGVNVTPLIQFSRTVRSIPNVTAPGIASADLNRLLGTMNDLLGIPSRLTQTFLGDLNSDTFLPFRTGDGVTLWSMGHRLKQYNVYVQDEWKLRRNFTINAGLRWEINPAPSEAHGRVYVPNKSILGSEGPVTFVKADRWFKRNNIGALGPRLGIAWSPWTSTVIRTGYGIAFDTVSSFQVTAVSGRVPGLVMTCSSTVGGATTPGCVAAPDVRLGEGFPNELPVPSVKPSSFLTPPAQLRQNAPEMTVFDQNLRIPTVHQWNFAIAQEFATGTVAQVAYVGRRGTRLFRAYDANQINSDSILDSFRIMQSNVAACGAPVGAECAPVPLQNTPGLTTAFFTSIDTRNQLRDNAAGAFVERIEQTTLALGLRPNQQFARINYIDSGGDSYYHSMQATIRKRFSGGLQLGAAYTLAKSIDNQSVDPVGSTSGGGLSTTNSRTPTDIRNWRNERGRSDFDRRHVFTANWVYELPFRASGPLNHLVGGWSVSGLFTAMSGEPFNLRSGVRTSNNAHESRADIRGNPPKPKLQAGRVGPVLFTTNAVCSESTTTDCYGIPQPGENGAGRNLFDAPGYWNLDLAGIKTFSLTERVRLQLRAEAFNAVNHVNFDNPRDATVGSPSVMSPQFGSTCCAAVAPPSTQTIIQTGEAARVLQFALKLQF